MRSALPSRVSGSSSKGNEAIIRRAFAFVSLVDFGNPCSLSQPHASENQQVRHIQHQSDVASFKVDGADDSLQPPADRT